MSAIIEVNEPLTVENLEDLSEHLNYKGESSLPKRLRPRQRIEELQTEKQREEDQRGGIEPTTEEHSLGILINQARQFMELVEDQSVNPHDLATYFQLCTDVQLTKNAVDLI